jgi:hypothetical protein
LAFYDQEWFVSSVAYAAVTARPQNASVAAGVVRRQFTAPAVNSERCFVCIVAGTTANVTDATWVLTRGAKTVDGTATWQECTGASAVNGDLASTVNWTAAKAIGTPTLGAIIKRNNSASYWIASTAGTMGASEPAWPNDTAGTTQADGTTTWTCLGVVGNFPAWGAPHARLANAYATNWGAAGHKFWIADNHAETQATGITLTNPATVAGGATYTICVDRTAALPPVEANYNTGATISTTAGGAISLRATLAGVGYYQGISFSAGDAAAGASIDFSLNAAFSYVVKNCAFRLNTTSAAGLISVGSLATASCQVLWDNCTVQFGAAAQFIRLNSVNFEWRNTASAVQGATLPTVLLAINTLNPAYVVCRGVDFSAFSGQLFMNNPTSPVPLVFEDCKFHASMTRYGTSTTSGYSSAPVITVRCDSGATNYKSTRDEYAGSQITETSITRVGGATDGTTPTSDKIVTNSQAAFLTPYRMLPLAIWNETTGANVTVTVYGTINAGSLPLNDEIWMDVQYLGSSGSPIASFKSSCKSHPLAAGAAVSSDGSTWNGGGSGAGWTPFKLVATLTSPQPQMKGFIYITVRAAKPSATYYIDALPALT